MLKLLLGLLGAAVVVVSFRLSWQVGYLASILFLFWLVRQVPEKLRRWALLAYLIFVIALLSSTAIHTMWVRNSILQRTLQRVGILRLLAGDTIRLGFWAFLLGLVIGAVAVSLALLALLYISSEAVLNLTTSLKIARKKAMRYLFDLFLQIDLPFVIVDNGQARTFARAAGNDAETSSNLLDRLGGPGWVIVKPGNAAVVEHLEGVREIAGPGFTTMERFDKVKAVDLCPQEELVTIHGVLTKDRVPLTFQVNVSFQIEPRADTDTRPEALTGSKHIEGVIDGIHPVHKESVFKAVYNVSKEGWQKETIRALESALRAAVFEYNLDELYDYSVTALAQSQRTVRLQMPTPQIPGQQKGSPLVISALKEKVKVGLAAVALGWGVRVNDVSIAKVEMPPQIHEMVLTWWKKKWETEIAKQDAAKEALVAHTKAMSRLETLSAELEGAAAVQGERLHRMLQVLQGADKKTIELLLHLVTRRPQYVDGRIIEVLSGGGPDLLTAGQEEGQVESDTAQRKAGESPTEGQGETSEQAPPDHPPSEEA